MITLFDGFKLCLPSIAVNIVGFIITAITKTHKITDLTGSLGFISICINLYYQGFISSSQFKPYQSNIRVFDDRRLVLIVLISLWAFRLGSYLFYRILETKTDKRLEKFFPKKNEKLLDKSASYYPLKLLFFYYLQTLWSVFLLIPLYFLFFFTSKEVYLYEARSFKGSINLLNNLLFPYIRNYDNVKVISNLIIYFPLFLSLLGFVIETVADYQKFFFFKNSKNSDKFCNVGLWSLAKYPNYFGEIIFWWGIWLNYFLAVVLPYSRTYENLKLISIIVTLLSPVFITYLLLKLSGIPIHERNHEKKHGHKSEYKKYKERTRLLVPLP